MMPARFYRSLPLLGSRPVRPFHPYQPSDWGALQRYARVSPLRLQALPRYVLMNPTWSSGTVVNIVLAEAVWP